MKKDSGNKVKLGIFVTAGIVLLFIAIYYIGQRQRMFANTFTISGVFSDVNGLQAGNNVRFAGINVGTVESIEIVSDTAVNVTMMIDRSTKKFIKTDSKAVIGSEGLMGNKAILIIPGNEGGTELEEYAVIQTINSASMDAILAQLQVTAENAAYITDDLASISSSLRQGKGTLGMLLMDTTMSKDVEQTLDNIKESSGGLKNSFLFRNYFKKKEKTREEKGKEKQ